MDAVTDNTPNTITLLKDTTGGGVKVSSGRNITFDLGGFTYIVTNPTVGSTGTETNGFQLLKDSNITFRNGTITASTASAKILIQNYCNLTLDNVKVLGINSTQYVVSNNYGDSHFKNGTEISALNGVAFDCYYGLNRNGLYDSGVTVTIDDDSVKVTGKVKYGADPGVASRLSPLGVSSAEEALAKNAAVKVPVNYPPLALANGLALVGSEDGQMKVVTAKAGTPSAKFGEGAINGESGMTMEAGAAIVVTVQDCTLTENADPKTWNINLPAGVEISSYVRSDDGKTMTVHLSGVPTEGKQGYITGKIPAGDISVTTDTAKELDIHAAAVWNIAAGLLRT